MEKTYSYEQIEEYIRDVAGYSQSEKQYEGALMLSQLLAKAKEWDEIEEMLKGCLIQLPTISDEQCLFCDMESDRWTTESAGRPYFDTLYAALSALVGGEKK